RRRGTETHGSCRGSHCLRPPPLMYGPPPRSSCGSSHRPHAATITFHYNGQRGKRAPSLTTRSRTKKEFATRLSLETLARLDQLVKSGRFRSRAAAIEAAVEHLYGAEQEEQEQLQQAFDRACGALSLGVDRARWQLAELDRLDWEASRNG